MPNVFRAAVHDSMYLGEAAQHLVNLLPAKNGDANGHAPLKVFDLHPKIVARDSEKEIATVWFRPENVVVLTR
jgi:hypothetical protein